MRRKRASWKSRLGAARQLTLSGHSASLRRLFALRDWGFERNGDISTTMDNLEVPNVEVVLEGGKFLPLASYLTPDPLCPVRARSTVKWNWIWFAVSVPDESQPSSQPLRSLRTWGATKNAVFHGKALHRDRPTHLHTSDADH
jgi:hypothetical protein